MSDQLYRMLPDRIIAQIYSVDRENTMTNSIILVVGSLNMDQIVHVPRPPVLGETLLGAGSLKLVPGGKGANQAVAMARLGAPVAMAGRVGTDPFGEQLLKALVADKIDTGLVAIDQQEASGVAFIFLAPDGENAIIVASGANMCVGQDQVQLTNILEAITQARALVLQLEIPLETVKTLITTGHNAGIPVILNLAPAQPVAWEVLRLLRVLIVNEIEASFLAGTHIANHEDARLVATALHEKGIPIVVITLGAQGAILARDDGTGNTQITYQAAPKVHVVDTTAAGDCFVGAFTVALTEQQSLENALQFAVYASALKVTTFGAQSGLPTRAEVDAFRGQ
jgi:ribokinase